MGNQPKIFLKSYIDDDHQSGLRYYQNQSYRSLLKGSYLMQLEQAISFEDFRFVGSEIGELKIYSPGFESYLAQRLSTALNCYSSLRIGRASFADRR